MERRLTTSLAANLAGYSRLMGEDEAGNVDALKARRGDFFGPNSAEHEERVVKLIGDGVLVEFPRIVEVVEHAEGIQRRMAERGPAAGRVLAARDVLERRGM